MEELISREYVGLEQHTSWRTRGASSWEKEFKQNHALLIAWERVGPEPRRGHGYLEHAQSNDQVKGASRETASLRPVRDAGAARRESGEPPGRTPPGEAHCQRRGIVVPYFRAGPEPSH